MAKLIESEHKRSLESGVGKDPTLQAIKSAETANRRVKIWEGIETQRTHRSRLHARMSVLGLTPKTLLEEAGSAFSRGRENCAGAKRLSATRYTFVGLSSFLEHSARPIYDRRLRA